MRLRLLLVLSALVMLLPQSPAWVQSTGNATWPVGTTVTMQLRLGVSPALLDGRTWDANAIDAMEIWNRYMRDVQFAWQATGTTTAASHNGLNDMLFADDMNGDAWGANTLALTRTWYSGTTRTESDILFNRSKTWDAYRGALRYRDSSGYPTSEFRRVAMHELGHVLGLGHPDEALQHVTALMNSTMSSLETLADDDKVGVGTLYGWGLGDPPVFQAQSADTAVGLGRSAVFDVTAFCVNPALEYRWQRLPAGSAIWGNLSDDSLYLGCRTATLVVCGVSQAMHGDRYRCLVGNTAGEVNSSPASLSVITKGSHTIAGARSWGTADGAGRLARFSGLIGIAVDPAGNLYVADSRNNTIRRVSREGIVTTLAGQPNSGGWTDGIGGAARFFGPGCIAFDRDGSLLVTEGDTHTIRRVTMAGVVTTVAGAQWQSGNVDGTALTARFNFPRGIAVDPSGNVFVADLGSHVIRKITAGGMVSTIAGLAGSPGSADGRGNAARFNYPGYLALDGAGNLFVTDTENNTIRKVAPDGTVTTFAGSAGSAGCADGIGTLARFSLPAGIAVSPTGDVLVADGGNQTIRRISSAGVVTTIAGKTRAGDFADGIGNMARFGYLSGLAIDSAGDLYAVDSAIRGYYLSKIAEEPPPPTISGLPASTSVVRGSTLTLSVTATGAGSLTYQWLVEDRLIEGATSATLSIGNVNEYTAGTYSVRVTNGTTTVTSSGVTVSVTTVASRLINLSTRARVGTGADVLIPGFVIGGDTPKRLLIRAVGPSLEPYGISDYLPDPTLELKTLAGTLVTTNDNWTAADAAVMQQAGAFSLPASSKDAAMVVSLPPGMYTAVVSDKTGRPGVGLVELYDLEPGVGKLINISTRARVGTGADVLIPGLVVDGNASKRLLIRAAGPALQPYGINDYLADPQMEVKTLAGVTMFWNDNWNGNDTALRAAFTTSGAFAFATGSKDAALLVDLSPGLYTVVVKGMGDTSGVALVEVYEIP